MNQPINMNPDGMRNAAAAFGDVADRTKRLLDALTGSTNSEGEAWGDDKAGKKFADGDEGFKSNRDNVFKSLTQLSSVFGANADNLRDSATTFEQNENSEKHRLTPDGKPRT